MLTGPRRKFCEGIVAGKTATDAYAAAYPGGTYKAARANGARLIAKDCIKAEIERMRAKAEEKAGSAVMTLAEKRIYLARAKRVNLGEFNLAEHGDLVQSIEPGEHGTKYRFVDKLAAIKLDNDLAGEGSEAEANDALAGLLERVMK